MLKSIVVSIFVVFSLLATVVAQPDRGGDPYERAERQTERMKEQLGLSDEQTEQVSEINIAAAEKMQEARQSANGDREAMRGKMMSIRQETDAALKEVLTEEQWTKLAAARQEMRQNRGRGRQGQGQGQMRQRDGSGNGDGQIQNTTPPKKKKKKRKVKDS